MYARRLYGMIIMGALLLTGCSYDDAADGDLFVTDNDAAPSAPVPITFGCTKEDTDPTPAPPLGREGSAIRRQESPAPVIRQQLPICEDGLTASIAQQLPAPIRGGVAEGRGGVGNTTRAIIGETGEMNSEDLCYTGFGVFASLQSDAKPDMMYNQEVTFTFVGDLDDPLRGYWSYQPVKYWPSQGSMSHFCICGYAPYTVLPPTITADDTGIIGISDNTSAPYIDYRRCLHPEDNVDLLWCYATPRAVPVATAAQPAGMLNLTMRHALARLQVRAKVASLPAGTKILVQKITLSGTMAATGRLHLNDQDTEGEGLSTKYYPVWDSQTYSPRTITIDSDETNADSYGIVAPEVRYIDGLPYSWQPTGLTTTYQNALNTIDRPTYVYLVPQPADHPLSLTIKVSYQKMTASGAPVAGVKTTTVSPTDIAAPLRGNTTYMLDLTLSDL